MDTYSYEMIFKKTTEAKGYSLDDFPSNYCEFMKAYEQVQIFKTQGISIANQLLNDTSMWLGILKDHTGLDSPKFIVASNKIVKSCIHILGEAYDEVCTNVFMSDLQPHEQLILSERLNDVQTILNRIGEHYMIPETKVIYKGMHQKLLIARQQLEAFVFSD